MERSAADTGGLPDLGPWPGLELTGPVDAGARSRVWRGRRHGEAVAIRHSRRAAGSLDWELDLLGLLDANGFTVPTVVAADDGRPHVDGVVVQRWLAGAQPATASDWRLIGRELVRLHALTADHPQRPGCCRVDELHRHRRSVDADLDRVPAAVAELAVEIFASVADAPVGVVHGDVHATNLRIGADGLVGFLDWDESRVDVVWHDLSVLDAGLLGAAGLDRVTTERASVLSHAWEVVNAWTAEPDYARHRLGLLHAAIDHPG